MPVQEVTALCAEIRMENGVGRCHRGQAADGNLRGPEQGAARGARLVQVLASAPLLLLPLLPSWVPPAWKGGPRPQGGTGPRARQRPRVLTINQSTTSIKGSGFNLAESEDHRGPGWIFSRRTGTVKGKNWLVIALVAQVTAASVSFRPPPLLPACIFFRRDCPTRTPPAAAAPSPVPAPVHSGGVVRRSRAQCSSAGAAPLSSSHVQPQRPPLAGAEQDFAR